MITKLNPNQFTFVTIENKKSPDDKCQGSFNVYFERINLYRTQRKACCF